MGGISSRRPRGPLARLLWSLGALLSAIGLTGSLFVTGGGAAVQIPQSQLVLYGQVPLAQDLLDVVPPVVDGAADDANEATGQE
jgi:hypothetical protein